MSRAQRIVASNGRLLALVVRADFDDFASHPPTFATEDERAWLAQHYSVASPEVERDTKAHLTGDELPLQLTILNRPAGAVVLPHYHESLPAPETPTRHQVMICLSGRARIAVFSTEGERGGSVDLGAGDCALLLEGHSIETLEDATRLLEIKQGPMPSDPFSDNVPVPGTGRER